MTVLAKGWHLFWHGYSENYLMAHSYYCASTDPEAVRMFLWLNAECLIGIKPLLFKRIAIHVVSVLLPESGSVALKKFQAAHPFD